MKHTTARKVSLLNTKNIVKQEIRLPDYLLEDLRIAFSLYEIPEFPGIIQTTQARGILWNFGFWRMTSKEFEKELDTNGVDLSKNTIEWNELVNIVTKRYYQGGKDQELKDTFKIFDRREKGTTTVNEIKNSLQSKLEVPITEVEIAEMFEMAGVPSGKSISLDDFMNL
ncbi:hypothetical protein SteCoe_17 [Stentor coeruleus]|uniref:EF-hand domain-containing protein n=1 Tax=Stentor coeruleus TaxID=5963 RepID=A0A1R2D4W0_9CILI|nr:hypothetical protein SteCoe_17 [Stentor coeruleus]